jgi:hypothetical protein
VVALEIDFICADDNLGISARNDFAMLKEIGGECAGAVTFVPTGDRLPENPNSHRTLSSSELAAVLRELQERPLLAGQEGIRQSLAGAQAKVAVCLSGDEISLPLDGAPSTHVLKPAVERFESVVQNESLCMRLAAAIGLPTAKVPDFKRTRGRAGNSSRLVQIPGEAAEVSVLNSYQRKLKNPPSIG